MDNFQQNISRRLFLGSSAAGSLGAMTATSALVSAETTAEGAASDGKKYQTIFLPPDSPLPLKTAAAELARATGAKVANRKHQGPIEAGEIVLAVGADVHAHPESKSLLPDPTAHREWELVVAPNHGLLLAGTSPRNVCRAALDWIENPQRETGRISVFRFEQRITMWDNHLNQMYRFSKGFNRRNHIREIARTGHTGIEINRYSYTGGYWVRTRKFPHDSYPWYMSYGPALDAFVESSLIKGLYPKEEIDANLADLTGAAAIANEYGLEPSFVCYEPRCIDEKIFDRYPELRGSRVDHPGRSLEPRYALDIANPIVLEHYAEMLTNLMHKVPDLRHFVIWCQDSGSGMPFARRLYFGPNGSYLARSKTLGQMAADFTGTLLDAGRKINPKFEVLMKMDWEYTDSERKEITEALPEGCGVAHLFGGGAFKVGEFTRVQKRFDIARQAGVKPYAALTAVSMYEQSPIVGICAPGVLREKIAALQEIQGKQFFNMGSTVAAPHCPYSISQEVLAELLRADIPDLDAFLLQTATHWCEGDAPAAQSLVDAWKKGEEAVRNWPSINWYHTGGGKTQARWLTRPLVPDFSLLDKSELFAWERKLFTLPWDIGRKNMFFEGGIRMYHEEQIESALKEYNQGTLPPLAETVAILDRAIAQKALPVLVDQRDRFQGMLHCLRTVRNMFETQLSINYYLMKQGDPQAQRDRLDKAIRAEIENTQGWLRLFNTSKTYFFRTNENEETPFVYKTPKADMALKLTVMQAHLEDAPGPMLAELTEKNSASNLLFYRE